MKQGHNFVTLAALVCMSWANSASGETPETFRSKLLANWESLVDKVASSRWDEKQETSFSLDTSKEAFADLKNAKPSFSYTSKWASTKNGSLAQEYREEVDKNGERTIRRMLRIANPRYIALLDYSTAAKGWLLRQFEQAVDQSQGIMADANRQRDYQRIPWMKVSTGLEFWQGLKNDEVDFIRTEGLGTETRNPLIRVFFTCKPVGEFAIARSGHIDLDPANHFRPTSYHFNTESSISNATYDGNWEYDDGPIPIPKRTVRSGDSNTTHGAIKHSVFREVCTFTNVYYNGIDPEPEFRLSHYGLPEPQGVTWPKPTPWYIYFIGVGVACLGVGAFIRWRLHRRISADLSPSK